MTFEVGDIVTVMKDGGLQATVIGSWQDPELDIEWIVLRVHKWVDDEGWRPTTELVPLICEPRSLLKQKPV